MAEPRKERRRSQRLPVQIPVVLQGTDASGRDFFDRTEIVSIDQRGARIRTRFHLKLGVEFEVQLPTEKETKRLRVVWQGEGESLHEGMVGGEFVDPNESWNLETLRAKWGAREF